jgi:1-pyrroline-5-carboxylate dehydrogenase
MLGEFVNEPYFDWSLDENRARMKQALKSVEGRLGREYPMWIGGQAVKGEKAFTSVNPADPAQVVGRFTEAGTDHVSRALDAATQAFRTWRQVPVRERAGYLTRAAAIMRRRSMELSAWMVHEVGKTWGEADADTAEAIDFLEFYAREALRLAETQPLTRLPGEDNELSYIPLGVGVVIPPWNFPLAIMAGMSTAAIVTGNTVVLKPSPDATTIASVFFEIMQETRLPAGVFNLVTGQGATVGRALVADKRTRFVAFTGSMQVGLEVNEVAAKAQAGQIWIKRAILEMGGKDAMIVDSDTDLDEAAAGVVQAAFGFSGQKCSACSRAIVDESVHDAFLEKLVAKTRALKSGAPADPDTQVGPVINEKQHAKILDYIRIGKEEGRLVCGGEPGPGKGWMIQPTIIADIKPDARLAQEEVFGPVLAVIKAKGFDHALEIANGTMFGLTGGVFTNDRAKLERARREFHVGNLYLNRKCTGAMVGAQPFGGFNMSGTDSKAGGRDYLQLFMQAKLVVDRL